MDLSEEYSSSFAEWKQDFIDIQKKVDMLIIYNNAGVDDWNDAEAKQWAEENTAIITGAVMEWMAPIAVITIDHTGTEQGEYASKTALRILDGEKPSDIPEAQNKEWKLILNVPLANKIGVVLKPELLNNAGVIIE